MEGEYKIHFEGFDGSKIAGTYTRLHYGKVSVDKLDFGFCVYETYLSDCKYLHFSLNFINAKPGRWEAASKAVIEKTKEKLKTKKR